MSVSNDQKGSVHEDIRTALVVFSFYVAQHQSQGKDLQQQVESQLVPEHKRTFEAAAETLLTRYRNETLASGVVQAVEKRIAEALRESRWTKWTIVITQGLGLLSAGIILKDFQNLPASLSWVLALYFLAMIGTLFAAIFRGR